MTNSLSPAPDEAPQEAQEDFFVDLEGPFASVPTDAATLEEGLADQLDDCLPAHYSPIIPIPEGATRGDVVAILSQDLPCNSFGFPIYFYRSDLLPLHAANFTQEEAQKAAVGLFYNEGYPTLEKGSSFWSQLPHEPLEAFKLFEAYIEQDEELGIRQLDILAATKRLVLSDVTAIYKEFYWSVRARAFDVFQTAAEQKRRERITVRMENRHFDQAGQLFARLMERFSDPEWIEELNAKEAIEAMETLIKIQRLSVGLTGQHASSNNGRMNTPGASAELILRQITKGSHLQEGGGNALQDRMRLLLADPEQGATLQELILRVNSEGFNQQHNPDSHFGSGLG